MRDFRFQLAALLALVALAALGGGESAFARAKQNTSGASAPPSKRNSSGSSGVPEMGDSQKDMCMNSYKLDGVGSDESLKNSAVYAMQALMDLSNMHLANAMKEGYSAYGKYRNAENLDNLKDKSALCVNSLVSVGTAPPLPTTRTDTTFRRLDASFLNQGEAAKVSAEFERATGMKRADFMAEMAKISEQKIKRSDPMMIDKAFSRFEGFLDKIPNKEFTKNARKAISMVPDTMRRGIVAQAVQKLAGMIADTGPASPPSVPSTIAALDKDKASGNPAGSGGGSGAVTGAADATSGKTSSEPAREPAATEGSSAAAGGARPPTGSTAATSAPAGRQGFVDGVVVAAILESKDQSSNAAGGGEDTIFQQVTKRYRILTPELLPHQGQ